MMGAVHAAETNVVALQDLVLIAGVSGAGKSTAMAAFEDGGYFCVDNLPPEMITSLVELFMHEGSKVEYAAVVSDVSSGEKIETLTSMLDQLGEAGVSYRVLFLDADDDTVQTRYKATRRRHPLARDGSVAEGVAFERGLLEPLRARADRVIATDGLTAAMLRRRLTGEMLGSRSRRLAVSFESFGFKYGVARDTDLMFDVRFLPNPHWDPKLRQLTGKDQAVVEYVNRDGELDAFYDRLLPLLDYLLPQYLAEGKAHLVVGIGCTGGRHRSVAIAEHLADRYREQGEYLTTAMHRDVAKPA